MQGSIFLTSRERHQVGETYQPHLKELYRHFASLFSDMPYPGHLLTPNRTRQSKCHNRSHELASWRDRELGRDQHATVKIRKATETRKQRSLGDADVHRVETKAPGLAAFELYRFPLINST